VACVSGEGFMPEAMLTDSAPTARAPLWSATAIIALLMVVAVAAGGAISALVRYDLVGFGHLPRSALFALFLLLLANAVTQQLRRQKLLTSPQLAYVYVAVLVMSGFPGQQLVTYLYLGMISSQHYATPENKYRELFMDYVPEWAVPAKDPEAPPVYWAFYGLPPGRTMPWRAWIRPLLAWTPYLLAVFGLQLSAAALLRRRWADEEHMLFPLARIPVELATYDEPRAALPGVFRHWMTWVFFLIPVIVHSKNALSHYFPQIPPFNLQKDFGVVFSGRPWTLLNWFPYYVYMEMMGIAYLVADDVSFSMWFFWVFRRLTMVARDAFGRTEQYDVFTHMGLGAYVLLAILYCWSARHSLRRIIRQAFVGAPDGDEAREPTPYRVTVVIFVVSVVVICAWGNAFGTAVWWTLLLLAFYMVSTVVLTRIVAESGVFAVWTPLAGQSMIVSAFGSRTVGVRGITALSYLGWKLGDTASCSMANILQGYHIADLARLRTRANFGLIVAALLVGLFASHWPSLYAIYSRSVPGLGWWPKSAGASLPQGIAALIQAPRPYTLGNYGNMAVGAAVTLALHMLRQRFLWWPFHPMGYAANLGPQWMGDRYGFSIFIGWLVRKLVHRFGGYRAYNQWRCAAIGITMGNGVILLIWTIVHYFRPIAGVLIIE